MASALQSGPQVLDQLVRFMAQEIQETADQIVGIEHQIQFGLADGALDREEDLDDLTVRLSQVRANHAIQMQQFHDFGASLHNTLAVQIPALQGAQTFITQESQQVEQSIQQEQRNNATPVCLARTWNVLCNGAEWMVQNKGKAALFVWGLAVFAAGVANQSQQ